MYYKVVKNKKTEKYYAQSVVQGKQVTTDKIADRLAEISTVSRGDVYAVLKNLGGVMGEYLAQGKSVKLDGLGSFRFTANAQKQGKDKAEEVDAKCINGVRVQFVQEVSRSTGGRVSQRSIVPDAIEWIKLSADAVDSTENEEEVTPSAPDTGDDGTNDDGGADFN